ncbi:hypothetical protein [Natronosalvus rutilus]|uniref:Uncharacterized protein n=1 Tax=Natronosalvus rutilus TaxID=2953753 RepID=A0A9E7SXY8_9EURY|nr:hypothetical protein [Natronosalvus rutilus]UTF54538.1 hypothetical protein NGM29_04495 [Natronosalvus rutilus]
MHTHRRSFVRDALVTTVVLAGLYALAISTSFQPLQIPGYLLVVGFGVLEEAVAVGFADANPSILFAAYVLVLGLVGAAIASLARGRVPDSGLAWVRPGVAGALAVVGALSTLLAISILLTTTQREPVVVTGVAGLILLGLASVIAGTVEIPLASSRTADR